MNPKNITLQPNEVISHQTRGTRLQLIVTLLPPAVLLLLISFFAFPMIQQGNLGTLAVVVIIMVSFLWIIRELLAWSQTTLVITTRRVIDFDRKGFFKSIISEVPIEKIEDVAIQKRTVFHGLTRTGDLLITVHKARTRIVARNITDAKVAQELLYALQKKAITKDDQIVEQLHALIRVLCREHSDKDVLELCKSAIMKKPAEN